MRSYEQAGFLSVLRAVNDGPQKLIETIMSVRTWSVLLYAELWLIMLLAIVDVTLRFSSTILLSDMVSFLGRLLFHQSCLG